MQPTRKTGRVIGILFVLIIALGATSLNLRGLSSSLMGSEDFLEQVFERKFHMRLSIMLNILSSLLWIGIAVYLFPFIKKISRPLAFWYLGLWFIQLCTTLMGDSGHLSLIRLSQEMQSMTSLDLETLNSLGRVYAHEYFWGHFFALMAYSSSTFLLFIAFFKGRWIPRVLSVWGMAAMTVVFSATVLQFFDVDVDFAFYQQNGYHFIALTLWLLIKGFSPKAETIS